VAYLITSNKLKYAVAFVLDVERALRSFAARSEVVPPWFITPHLSATECIRLASFMGTIDKNRGHEHNKVFLAELMR